MDRLSSMKKIIAAAPRIVARRGDLRDAVGDFLAGRSAGRAMLAALFDHILDEPVPQRIAELFRRQERTRDGSRSAPPD